MDPTDKNWYIHESTDHSMGPAVLAEVSCANDHAHLGYLIEDSKTLKTGLGRRHFEGPLHTPQMPEYQKFYVINSAALKFIPLRCLNERQL